MKNILKWYLSLGIYLKLLPFLLLYLAICIVFNHAKPVNDEIRYLFFANNILHGFYSPPYPKINLWNGPGYPLLIAPFILLKSPLLVLHMLNAFLLYFSLIIVYQTISVYSSTKNALLFSFLLGLYFPEYVLLPGAYTEIFTWFLISIICFLFIKYLRTQAKSHKLLLLTSFFIAYLVMTKLIFFYVVVAMLFASLLIFILPAFKRVARKPVRVFLLSFAFCIPYLSYTYCLTGKIFYLSNAASMSLYTMSSPFPNELGDWFDARELKANPNHKILIDSVEKLQPLMQDAAIRAKAFQNIKDYPQKYASNWLANVGRLMFDFPFSNKPQSIRPFFKIIPNMMVLILMIISLAAGIYRYKKLPPELIWLFMFFVIYLFGSSLLSAYNRMFYVTMPFWCIYFSFVFTNILLIRFRDKEEGPMLSNESGIA